MSLDPSPLLVGAVVFPGFNLLDLFGPVELLGMLQERVRITLLAQVPGRIDSEKGPGVMADGALADPGPLDVLLVPGGGGTRPGVMDAAFISELGRQADKARFVASVCTGSALLAKSGVLDGHRATTNKRAFAWASSQGPRVTWVAKARWVEDGKFFTSSGVSAGMDMCLGLIAHLFGREASVEVAARAEYAWHEDRDWDPFAAMNGLA